ncbi:MAG: hypothetical protein H0W72_00170 [Planctomycetes bacterium]|nr:hypothetical protein [Planctomycetota bacterium]
MTLIEVLVVLSIIVLLVGLLLPLALSTSRTARAAGTSQRMQGVIAGLQALGDGNALASEVIQRRAGLGGVARFGLAAGRLNPAEGSWLDYTQPYHLRFPVGQSRLRFTAAGNSLPVDDPPAAFALADLRSANSLELLVAAGVLSDAAAYAGDRSSGAVWNDRWGEPLVVAYAFYQYGPNIGEAMPPSAQFDNQWRHVIERYGRSCSLLLCVGAVGPTAPAGFVASDLGLPAQRPAALASLWAQIEQTANRNAEGDVLWSIDPGATPPIDAVASPPWKGIRQASGANGTYCLLTAPIDVL